MSQAREHAGRETAAAEAAASPEAQRAAPALQHSGTGPDRLLRLLHDGSAAGAQGVLALQRAAGNAAVGRLARQAGPAAAPPAVSPAVQAVQAEAAETLRRMQSAHRALLASSKVLERNTGELFSGPSPRMAYVPMTRRSDSEQIRIRLGRPAGSVAYFFIGVTQPPWDGTTNLPAGTEVHTPTAMGTINRATNPTEVDTILVRGKLSNGTWYSEAGLKQTFIHEASHILVASYGQHPGTVTNSASFDRYRDEFRSYWISEYSHLPPNERWTAIRTHLVGSSATSGGYQDLRQRYWATTPTGQWANPGFRAQVDAHRAADGYNLTNSIRLDRLFTALAGTGPNRTTDAIRAILRLRASERAEAARSSLITQRIQAIGGADGARLRRALTLPTHAEFTSRLNPDRNPRISRFLVACALNEDEDIKAAYRALTATERGSISMEAAVMVFVDHHVGDEKQRASVYAMLVTGMTAQYDLMGDFLDQCFLTFIDASLNTLTGPPPELLAALGRIRFAARLALYRLVEPARRTYVDSLPDAVKRPILRALRGDHVPGVPDGDD